MTVTVVVVVTVVTVAVTVVVVAVTVTVVVVAVVVVVVVVVSVAVTVIVVVVAVMVEVWVTVVVVSDVEVEEVELVLVTVLVVVVGATLQVKFAGSSMPSLHINVKCEGTKPLLHLAVHGLALPMVALLAPSISLQAPREETSLIPSGGTHPAIATHEKLRGDRAPPLHLSSVILGLNPLSHDGVQ